MKPLNHKKNWTPQDDEYLGESWGHISLGMIAENLQRTEESIRTRAKVLCLGKSRYAGGIMYSPPQIANMLGKCRTEIYRLIDEGIIKGRKRKLINEKAYQVHVDNLMEFLEKHPDKWDSRKVEEFAFGVEPDWMKEKREKDKKLSNHRKPWTKYEDSQLVWLVREGHSMKEIAEKLGRTVNGVYQRTNRIRKKGILKPAKIQLPWTDEEWQMVLDLEEQGFLDEDIAYEIGRETCHIRDKRRKMREKGLYKGYKQGFSKRVV